MTLSELNKHVVNAIEKAKEYRESPDNILVSLQINGPHGETVWATSGLELLYDNNGQASGCVLTGEISGREA